MPHHYEFVMALLSEKPERIQQQFELLLKPKSKPETVGFFTPLDEKEILLECLKQLYPRRASVLNSALNLHLNKKSPLTQDDFNQFLEALFKPDAPKVPFIGFRL